VTCLQIKFTCNLCGTTSIRPVNPHAWAKGSVFGRCGGCNVIHKVCLLRLFQCCVRGLTALCHATRRVSQLISIEFLISCVHASSSGIMPMQR